MELELVCGLRLGRVTSGEFAPPPEHGPTTQIAMAEDAPPAKRRRTIVMGSATSKPRPKKTRKVALAPSEVYGEEVTGLRSSRVTPPSVQDEHTVCLNPMPPLTADLDFCGNRIPVRTWSMGNVYGGDNVPVAHKDRLRTFYRWYTQDVVDRLLLPFVRRDTSSSHDPGESTSIFSLRNLETLLCGINLEDNMTYRIRTAKGTTQVVAVQSFYRHLMDAFHRRGVDTVRRNQYKYARARRPEDQRNQRCYVRGSDGVVYPTTIPQLLMIMMCWKHGIIFLGVMLVDYIAVWREHTRAAHKAAKAKAPGRRVRMTRPHATDAKSHVLCVKDLPIIFTDTHQFDIIRTGVSAAERAAFVSGFLSPKWLARIKSRATNTTTCLETQREEDSLAAADGHPGDAGHADA